MEWGYDSDGMPTVYTPEVYTSCGVAQFSYHLIHVTCFLHPLLSISMCCCNPLCFDKHGQFDFRASRTLFPAQYKVVCEKGTVCDAMSNCVNITQGTKQNIGSYNSRKEIVASFASSDRTTRPWS